MKMTFALLQKAKSSGGDKYAANLETEDKPVVFYFPQSVSRNFVTKEPHKLLYVRVEEEDFD